MTNEQILKKAIEKAIKNGWEGFDFVYETQGLTNDPERIISAIESVEMEYGVSAIPEIISSHDFAKAFWGEKEIIENKALEDEKNRIRWVKEKHFEWQYHLQQMVLEKEPLKYLEKFL